MKTNNEARQSRSNQACKEAFQARMMLVTNDETVIRDEIKPLLGDLAACTGDAAAAGAGTGNVTGGGGGFLEIKATATQCKHAARKKLRRLQASLLQVSLSTPVEEVTGSMEELEKRVAAEKEDAQRVRTACEAEASEILTTASTEAEGIFTAAKTTADTNYDNYVIEVDTETKLAIAELEKIKTATEAPFFAAEAAFEEAKTAFQQAEGAHLAAQTLQTTAAGSAQEALDSALVEAENAKRQTINSTNAAAEAVRRSAREDKQQKSSAKTSECNDEHETFVAERDLVAKIEAKIAKLATVRDDTTGETATEAVAPSASDSEAPSTRRTPSTRP